MMKSKMLKHMLLVVATIFIAVPQNVCGSASSQDYYNLRRNLRTSIMNSTDVEMNGGAVDRDEASWAGLAQPEVCYACSGRFLNGTMFVFKRCRACKTVLAQHTGCPVKHRCSNLDCNAVGKSEFTYSMPKLFTEEVVAPMGGGEGAPEDE
jgi:hypothetical protein